MKVRQLPNEFRKASLWGAFLVFAICSWSVAAGCPEPEQPRQIQIRTVFDGDTVKLSDGEHVRLIGINTPEVARADRPAEPLSSDAATFLQHWLKTGEIYMQPGLQRRDRYQRLLAHLYRKNKNKWESAEEAMLEQGYGFHVAFPPNLQLADCLSRAEQKARANNRGVWGNTYYLPIPATELGDRHRGFRRVEGRVENVLDRRKGGWWILLDGELALQVSRNNEPFFNEGVLREMVGENVVVKGWISGRKLSASQKNRGFKRFQMQLTHPSMMQRKVEP